MGKINILDASVANMIAAGEVVERPASVVKELVENALDAGASEITIEIKNGGISYIRVTDNGRGIDAGDVGLAFMRHATSKILEAKDLEKIGTLGFRGEALCSIAAVARVSMTTKTAEAKNAVRVYIEGGEMEDVGEAGAPDGTTVEVKNLFYNTPARMKFLKKDTTEAGYITDIVEKFVLSHPDVSFRFINNGKQVLFSAGDGSMVNAIYTVYGKDYARSVLPIDYGDSVIRATGYIGKSNISRPNRRQQSFFVNGRSIQSKTMTAALEEAYKNQIMIGKFPFAVIDLLVNPAFVDVNVHPHKTEVKFSDERKVFDTVYWAVKNALYEKPIVPHVELAKTTPKKEAYKSEEFTAERRPYIQVPIPGQTEKAAPAPRVQEYRYQTQQAAAPVQEPAQKQVILEKSTAFLQEMAETPYQVQNEPVQQPSEQAEDTPAAPSIEPQPASENMDYKIVGQLFDTYIILERGDEALLIDQHAAHERLNYEQLRRDLAQNTPRVQSLLSPVVVDLSAPELSYVAENLERFAALGFDASEFGKNAVLINGAPMGIAYEDIGDLFVELTGQMMAQNKQIISETYEYALYTIACKAAIKANHRLSEAEIHALVDEVFALDGINTCPHGRPITISLTKRELEKQFKRIV
ncbi:MAG TPA: DNA mismatch repair endonuclease MutL [Candidatus Aphodoplasma excrementigallinarum]|uniref:DNA mismatch repair protein MutL n=1 Tax=Candidatus Aphodoplasma excrementigallinarum TaxID=2840673 RepID=A0A9D1NGV2_9FIRM|nr:DNA mismatch repair endonuclease MutL [Candidatus Aphodoplasma excrementigallinarum]